MFRHLMTLAALAASGLAAAAAPGPGMAAARPAGAGVSALGVLDPQTYVQSELDWRSYYLNRFAAARAGDAAGRASPATGSGS